MGVDHLSGATCCRCQQRHYLEMPCGVCEGGASVGVYICV